MNIDVKGYIKKNKLKKIIKKIDNKLFKIIKEDLYFFKILKRFVIQSGGKRIRPLTHYYFCKLINSNFEEWDDIGAIGELVHSASLLHDDVIDNSEFRRGKPALHTLYGNKKTILGGDYLLACGLEHLSKLKQGIQLLPIFTRVIRNLAVSEILQMEYESNPKITKEIYETIILGKTADLFSAMTESAALINHLNAKQIEVFKECGRKMGRIFQIRDDYLDFFSTEEKMGKALYLDYQRGLITYPMLLLKKELTIKEKKEIFSDWKDLERRMGNLNKTLELFEKYKIKEKIVEEIKKEISEIIEFINSIDTKNITEKRELIYTLEALLV
ncbi:MAG: polyprenyl synthetase family protein [Leptonema sp. (in: bacteria)]